MSAASETTGLVLAGGKARRMGGDDKGLLELHGKPMTAHVIDVLRPQVAAVLVNANRNQERYSAFGWQVIADDDEGFLGPLAGMASGMRAAATPLLATAPCDSPFIPGDLVARLYQALQTQAAEIAVAHDGDRLQPVFCLLRVALLDSVTAFLASGERKIDRWFAAHHLVTADFSGDAAAFRNINTPAEHAEAERLLQARR